MTTPSPAPYVSRHQCTSCNEDYGSKLLRFGGKEKDSQKRAEMFTTVTSFGTHILDWKYLQYVLYHKVLYRMPPSRMPEPWGSLLGRCQGKKHEVLHPDYGSSCFALRGFSSPWRWCMNLTHLVLSAS